MNKLNKSVDDIRKELFEFIESKQDDYIKKGFLPTKINLNKGILRGMLEVFIFGIWQLYNTMSKILMQAIPIHSTGDWLKLHAESVGLTPKKKTKAIGVVQFTRDIRKTGNINIAQNKIVGTLPDGLGQVYRYAVTKDTVLLADKKTVFVEVESEDYGEKVNAEHGMITQLITPIPGISSVMNIKVPVLNPLNGNTLISWLISEGTDDESDTLLRERYIAQWHRITGVTSNAYIAAALSVNAVTSVSVEDQHPRGQGTIDIYIRTSAKEEGAGDTVKDVENAIMKEIMINDDVKVMNALNHNIDIEMEVESKGVNLENLKDTIKNTVKAYIDTLVIGEDVVRDKVASTIINLEGVRKINWLCFSKAPIHLTPIEPIDPSLPVDPDVPAETLSSVDSTVQAELVLESIVVARSELAQICCLKITTKEFVEELDEAITNSFKVEKI